MDDSSLVSPCLKAFVWTDHDGRALKWPYLVWMKSTARSTRVMGFKFLEGFAHDYEWTTRMLGMIHYRFWGNRYDCPTLDGFPTLKFSLRCIHQSVLYPTSQLSGRVPGGCDTYRWDICGEDLPRETESGGRGGRPTPWKCT